MFSTERFVDYTMVAFHMNLINESGHMVLPACQATLKSHEAVETAVPLSFLLLTMAHQSLYYILT